MQEREQLQLLVDYFRQGCKKDHLAGYGVEIEHITVRPETGRAVTYYEEDGIEQILQEAALLLHGQRTESEGHLLGLACPDYTVSLEPAAQFEISIRPKMEIADIRQIYRRFRVLVDPIFAKHNAVLKNIGYQPVSRVDDLPLIPKKRYLYMDRFFQSSGQYGRNMMRGTASTQVSIDYISEEDFVRKMRLAYILGPLFSLLTDNAPVFEGAPTEGHLLRTRIWRNVDPSRCGIIPGLENRDFGFEAYARFLWNMPLILRTVGTNTDDTGHKTTREVYAGADLTEEDIAHIVSMDFPDVRLKQYVEIRMADSLPEDLAMGYAALIKGIFSSQETIERLLAALPNDPRAILEAQDSLMRDGFRGTIYGRDAAVFADRILELACDSLSLGEKPYLNPFGRCIAARKTWAEEPYEGN